MEIIFFKEMEIRATFESVQCYTHSFRILAVTRRKRRWSLEYKKRESCDFSFFPPFKTKCVHRDTRGMKNKENVSVGLEQSIVLRGV